MSDARFTARYRIETLLRLEQVPDIMAGEQSCGTFTRVEGETEELRERAGAVVAPVASTDLLLLAGGGIMAHPHGPAEGVASIRKAWRAVAAGGDLELARRTSKELDGAFAQFGAKP
jgi:ribulose 1,5-bisphosphate carboxylase large subunit-like protein